MFFPEELPSKAMIRGHAENNAPEQVKAIDQALKTIRWANLLIRDIEAYCAKHSLTQLQFLILIVIDREPARQWLYHREICARIDVSKPVMTRATRTLEERGLLRIEMDPSDGRARRMALSLSAWHILEATLPGYFDIHTDRMKQAHT